MLKKKYIKELSVLWASSMVSALFAFLTQMILARTLSASEFGSFSAAIGTVVLISPFVGFGISSLWLKVFGEEGWQATRWLPSSFKIIFISTFVVLFLLIFWSINGPHSNKDRDILLILSFYLVSQSVIELISAKYQLEERYFHLSLWQLLPNLLRLIFVSSLFFLYGINTIYSISISYALISLFFLIIGIRPLFNMYRGDFVLAGHSLIELRKEDYNKEINIKRVFLDSWPFGLAGIFYLIYYQSDIVLLKYLAGDAAAGFYSVAFTVLTAIYILPGVVYQKFLMPKIHRWIRTDKYKLFKVYRQGNRLMAILGCLFMISIFVFSPNIISILFGEKYKESIQVLMILSFAIPIRFLASGVGSVLATNNNMRKKVLAMAATAVINIAMNVFLIPIYGINGAAIATIISDAFLMMAYLFLVRKFFNI